MHSHKGNLHDEYEILQQVTDLWSESLLHTLKSFLKIAEHQSHGLALVNSDLAQSWNHSHDELALLLSIAQPLERFYVSVPHFETSVVEFSLSRKGPPIFHQFLMLRSNTILEGENLLWEV